MGGGEDTLAVGEGVGGGSIFWKTRDIGLPSYSNNLSMDVRINGSGSVPKCLRSGTHEKKGEKLDKKQSWDPI